MSQEITTDEVRRIAALARLRLQDEEVTSLVGDMTKILGYVSTLAELKLDRVAPSQHAEPPAAAPMRADVPTPGLTTDEALAAAPERELSGFLVPKVVS